MTTIVGVFFLLASGSRLLCWSMDARSDMRSKPTACVCNCGCLAGVDGGVRWTERSVLCAACPRPAPGSARPDDRRSLMGKDSKIAWTRSHVQPVVGLHEGQRRVRQLLRRDDGRVAPIAGAA